MQRTALKVTRKKITLRAADPNEDEIRKTRGSDTTEDKD